MLWFPYHGQHIQHCLLDCFWRVQVDQMAAFGDYPLLAPLGLRGQHLSGGQPVGAGRNGLGIKGTAARCGLPSGSQDYQG
jgi:hypothetical protein